MKIFGYNLSLKAEKLKRVAIGQIGSMVQIMGVNQENYIKQGYKANPSLYTAVNWIAKRAAMTPVKLFDCSGEEKEEITSHEILDLLERPNPIQGKQEFFENFLGFKLISGESFMYGAKPTAGKNKGVPKELWVLAPAAMQVKFDQWGIPKEYKVGRSGQILAAEDVLYVKYWNPDGERGMSPIEAGIAVLQQSNDGYLASAKLLQNLGAQGVLSLEDEDVEFTQKQADEMEQKYVEKYGGPLNHGRIMIASGKWSWQQIGLRASDLELLDSQNMAMRDICNLYNLNSQLFNDPDNKTYNNVKEARKSGLTDAVIPELKLLEGELNRWLVDFYSKRDGREYKIEFDTSIFPELKEDEALLAQILTQSWWMSPNERRERQGLDQREEDEMDNIYIPSGTLPLTDDPLEKAYSSTGYQAGESDVA